MWENVNKGYKYGGNKDKEEAIMQHIEKELSVSIVTDKGVPVSICCGSHIQYYMGCRKRWLTGKVQQLSSDGLFDEDTEVGIFVEPDIGQGTDLIRAGNILEVLA